MVEPLASVFMPWHFAEAAAKQVDQSLLWTRSPKIPQFEGVRGQGRGSGLGQIQITEVQLWTLSRIYQYALQREYEGRISSAVTPSGLDNARRSACSRIWQPRKKSTSHSSRA